MRIILGLILLLGFSSNLWASELHIYAPTVQLRFEDKINQEIGFNNYTSFMLAGTYNSKWWAGLTLDHLKQSTGSSPQLEVENNFYETNAALGYIVYSQVLDHEDQVWFDLIPLAHVGLNWSRVKTKVMGDSKVDSSKTDMSIGAGGIAQLRLFAFIFQLDFRYANSGAYQPSFVPSTSVRIGFRLGL